MSLITAIRKLYKVKGSKTYCNSDHVLNVKEKKILLTCGFLIIFPFIIASAIILINL